MWKIIIICLCFFAIHSNADSSPISRVPTVLPNVTSSYSSFDMDKDIAEIASSCLYSKDHREILGNTIGPFFALCSIPFLIENGVNLIAYSEMRAALGFPPRGPWKHYKKRNLEELEFATPEEYFEFREETKDLSLDSAYVMEKNFPPVIKFLDERFPAFRKIFKHKFNNIHRANPIDRETIDAFWNEYVDHILTEMTPAIHSLAHFNDDCPYE